MTGAGRGIRRAIALELAAAGARVAVLARSADELDEVAGTVRDRGGLAGVFPADPAQVAGAMTRITAELCRVSILISNAAVVWPLGPTVTVTLAAWSAATPMPSPTPPWKRARSTWPPSWRAAG